MEIPKTKEELKFLMVDFGEWLYYFPNKEDFTYVELYDLYENHINKGYYENES